MMMPRITRAFTAQELLARRHAPMVRTADELRQHITRCLTNSEGCWARLACDIFIDRPIVLPDGLLSFCLMGDGWQRIVATQNLDGWFDNRIITKPHDGLPAPIRLNNFVCDNAGFTIGPFIHSSITTSVCFIRASSLEVHDATFLFAQTGMRVFGQLDNIYLYGATEIVGNVDVGDSTFINVVSAGTLKIQNNNADGNTFVGCIADEVNNTGFVPASSKRNTFVNVIASPRVFSRYDIVLDNDGITAPMFNTAQATVTLTADNSAVDVTGIGALQVSSDSAVAGSRTFTLSGTPHSGQRLTLSFSGTNTADIVDDSGIGLNVVRLAGNMTFTQYDTLELMHDGTQWLELGRSAN